MQKRGISGSFWLKYEKNCGLCICLQNKLKGRRETLNSSTMALASVPRYEYQRRFLRSTRQYVELNQCIRGFCNPAINTDRLGERREIIKKTNCTFMKK
jgi:hypothetical protein